MQGHYCLGGSSAPLNLLAGWLVGNGVLDTENTFHLLNARMTNLFNNHLGDLFIDLLRTSGILVRLVEAITHQEEETEKYFSQWHRNALKMFCILGKF